MLLGRDLRNQHILTTVQDKIPKNSILARNFSLSQGNKDKSCPGQEIREPRTRSCLRQAWCSIKTIFFLPSTSKIHWRHNYFATFDWINCQQRILLVWSGGQKFMQPTILEELIDSDITWQQLVYLIAVVDEIWGCLCCVKLRLRMMQACSCSAVLALSAISQQYCSTAAVYKPH